METKVAIVTGASSGIGEATARRLRQLGYTVYAAARRVERMAELGRDGIRVVKVDVTDDASVTALVDRVISETGRVDVLVNNAGYGSYGAVEDVPLAEARRQFDVNVFGLARLTQLVLPHMRERRAGRIINISSVGGKIYEPMGGWYHATKFAVEGLSDSMRVELAPFGIDVVLILPGAIKTEWGGIAAESLLATSGHTAYSEQATMVSNLFGAAESTPRLVSPPEVIANAVAKAVTARRRPKTRYVVGGGAKPIVFARRVLSDRAFDRLIVTMFRAVGRQATKRIRSRAPMLPG